MSKIVIIGEAQDRDEEALGAPFVGASGAMLLSLLIAAKLLVPSPADKANIEAYWRSGHDTSTRNPYFNWLVWQAHSEFYITNVFNLRPKPTNDVKNLCGPRAEGIPGWPALQAGKYVRKEYEPELTRLQQELTDRRPNLIVAFGATPSWALLKTSGITKIRGTAALSSAGIKVLPTYHPTAIIRDYSLRPVVIADLIKARREAEFPEIRRPHREIWTAPSIEDLDKFEQLCYSDCSELSIDIETKGEMITCVGFAPRPDIALVVPFYDPTKPDGNYWTTETEERYAWKKVKEWCALDKRMVFQNGMYDIHLLWRVMGITVPHAADDTMLLHHALQLELKKGLGFLGSIYTNEASWKFMRGSNATLKREDT